VTRFEQLKSYIKKSSVLPVLVAVVAVLVACPSQAQFTYTTNNGTITITGYTGTNGEVTIPGQINSARVTAIGDNAFAGNTNLTSVVIPNSVASIGASAFDDCSSLTNAIIGNSVASIGNDAFTGCTSLSSVTIPNSVTSIGVEAFSYCANLVAINVDVSSTSYSSVNGILFDKSQTAIVEYPAGKLESSYAIPNSVVSIGTNAFNGNTNLARVTIPTSVTSIKNWAFVGCRSLTSITIHSSVTNIADNAFWYCYSLQGIFFEGNRPAHLVFYPSQILDGPKTVYYLPGTTGWDAYPVGDWVYPAVLWNPVVQSYGVQNNQFNFSITGTTNIPIVVEASTALNKADWVPLQTNTLSNGLLYFRDLEWTNHPIRFYRIRSP
jgi:hypothetical protein